MPPPESATSASSNRSADWIAGDDDDYAFARTVAGIWDGRWVILGIVVVALAGAVVYLHQASKVYQAQSEILASPLPATASVQGLGLILQSADPLRDVQTASEFVTTPSVAQRVISSLRLHESPQALLGQVSIAPIAESDIVDIAVDAGSPGAAQRLANAFAVQTLNDRTAALDSELSTVIPRLKAEIAAVPAGNPGTRASLSGQLAELETLDSGPTPDLRVAGLAQAPTSPISPRKAFTLAAALVGGLVVGIGLVFLIQLLDPRLRREEELADRFRLPILARVPREHRKRRFRRKTPMLPGAISPQAADAYRTLRTALSSSRRRTTHGHVILVTGSTPSEGKTTTAINLASALAASDAQVMLIEADLRRPTIGKALDIETSESIHSVLHEEVLFGQFRLGDALVDTALSAVPESRHVRLLLASRDGVSAQPLSSAKMRSILAAAREISDWVVVDGPPLLYAPDLLGACDQIDDVILVARLGTTGFDDLLQTAELLAQHAIVPAGFVVVGSSGRAQYY